MPIHKRHDKQYNTGAEKPAIFPVIGILRISNKNSFTNVKLNNISEIIRSSLYFLFMPGHIIANEQRLQ